MLPDIPKHRVSESGHGTLLPYPRHALHVRPPRAPACGHLPPPLAATSPRGHLPPDLRPPPLLTRCSLRPDSAGADAGIGVQPSGPPPRPQSCCAPEPRPLPRQARGSKMASGCWPVLAGSPQSRQAPALCRASPLLCTLALAPADPAALGHRHGRPGPTSCGARVRLPPRGCRAHSRTRCRTRPCRERPPPPVVSIPAG